MLVNHIELFWKTNKKKQTKNNNNNNNNNNKKPQNSLKWYNNLPEGEKQRLVEYRKQINTDWCVQLLEIFYRWIYKRSF